MAPFRLPKVEHDLALVKEYTELRPSKPVSSSAVSSGSLNRQTSRTERQTFGVRRFRGA